MRWIISCILLFHITCWNVENLFHPSTDSINTDTEFTPAGPRRWTYTRYWNKVHHLARTLTLMGEWDGVDLIGLCEVESDSCLINLCSTIAYRQYDYIHYDSPDPRGIDCAILYRKSTFTPISHRPVRVDIPGTHTRDLLYLCGETPSHDTLHILMCHLPSKRGGAHQSEYKRVLAKRTIQNTVDSIFLTDSAARIIVMGDMNDSPLEDIHGLSNQMLSPSFRHRGTYKYQGIWDLIDQCYLSPSLIHNTTTAIYDAQWLLEDDPKYLGAMPMRCYRGFHYQNGYSDHLPLLITISSSGACAQ